MWLKLEKRVCDAIVASAMTDTTFDDYIEAANKIFKFLQLFVTYVNQNVNDLTHFSAKVSRHYNS